MPEELISSRPKILLTEGSSTSSRQTLYALGGRYQIDAMDPAWLCQARFSRFVRKIWRCPPFGKDPGGYLRRLLEVLTGQHYDVLFPTHEQVYLASRFREQFAQLAAVAVPPFEALERLLSKVAFVELLDELGLPHPPTRVVSGRQLPQAVREFPIFLKVDFSTAGEGVRFVTDQEQLQRVLTEFESRGWLDDQTQVLVQNPARGIKGAVSGVFQDGQLVAYHCDEALALGVGGSTLARVTVDDPLSIRHLQIIGAHLNWHGPLAIEVFRDKQTGSVEYLECNPRIGETFNPTLAGVNFCEVMVRISCGQNVEPLPPPRIGVKTHQGFLGLMATALRDGTRRAVFRELMRWLAKAPPYADAEDELMRPREDWLSVLPAFAVTVQLLLWPGWARRIVRKTVENYALTAATLEKIRKLQWPQPEANSASSSPPTRHGS